MWCQGCGLSAVIAWSMLVVVVCSIEVPAAQGPGDRAFGVAAEQQTVDIDVVDRQELSKALLKIERALRGIQRRAAGDHTLKRLADGPIDRSDYANAKRESKGCRLAIGVPTDDQIEVPAKGSVVRVPGGISVHVEYLGRRPDADILSGLHNGLVTWKTNNPHVFVKLFWCSNDTGAPDRLLAIVREELEREGLSLLPMDKLDWPVATASERLSQLLPPDFAPPVAPRTETVAASPQSPAIVFASPRDVVAAHNQAVAKKDWQAYAICLTPASQGAVIREVLFLAQMGGEKCPELIKTIEKHVKFKLYDDRRPGAFAQSKEAEEFFESSGEEPSKESEAADAWLYEVFRKRVGDVPAFLADCLRQLPGPPEGYGKPIECDGIRIEGDKASGYVIHRRPAPAPEEVEKQDETYYMPRYVPIRFRRIGGSWLIAFTFGDDE